MDGKTFHCPCMDWRIWNIIGCVVTKLTFGANIQQERWLLFIGFVGAIGRKKNCSILPLFSPFWRYINYQPIKWTDNNDVNEKKCAHTEQVPFLELAPIMMTTKLMKTIKRNTTEGGSWWNFFTKSELFQKRDEHPFLQQQQQQKWIWKPNVILITFERNTMNNRS